ncbi:MAG: biopolymer transporter ExbD [Treponema sp.]|nr:biopolymer transporter ExbD [Treponema sp.]
MKLSRKPRRTFETSGASSDIAFLLIIYFIVIAGFNINRGFLVNLPAKDSTRLILKEDLLRFELDRGGTILFRGEALSVPGAEEIIAAGVRERPNLAVVLLIDPLSPWQQVVSFVELAQKLEVDAFSFKLGEGGTRDES